MNPYGLQSASQADSDTSSDRLSQFGTARDYPDFDLQNDIYWYDEKDEDYFMTPCFAGSEFYGCPSQDKFVTTLEKEKQLDNTLSLHNKSEGFQTEAGIDYLDKPCLFNMVCVNGENEVQVMDYYPFDKCNGLEEDIEQELKNCDYDCSLPLCTCCEGRGVYDENPVNFSCVRSKETDLDAIQLKAVGDSNADYSRASEHKSYMNLDSAKRGSNDWIDGFKGDSDLVHKIAKNDLLPNAIDGYGIEVDEDNGEPSEPQVDADEEGDATDELQMYSNEDEYEVFNLRIVHRKNRLANIQCSYHWSSHK